MKNLYRPYAGLCSGIFLIFVLSTDLLAQNLTDPCISLTTIRQTARGTEKTSKRIQLSSLDPALLSYWNSSTESVGEKLGRVRKELNAKNEGGGIAYTVDECPPDDGGGGTPCTVSAPNAPDVSRCGPGTVELTGFPGSGGNRVYWYETESSLAPLSTDNLLTVNISLSRYYYASTYNTSNSCESNRIAVYAEVNDWGVDGVITSSATAVYLGQSIKISSSGGSGTPHYWCSTNGGSSWNIFSDSRVGLNSFTFTPTAIGTYRFMLRNKTVCGYCYDNGSCPNYPYVEVVVINSAPPSPTTQSAFIYGHDNSLLTAEVKNANQNQVAFSSFESSAKGNWTYTGTPAGNTNDPGRTGIKYYNLSSGSIQRTGLPSGKYMLTYWSDAAATVSGTNYTLVSQTLETTINGWKLYRLVFTLSADLSSITITGNAKLDELRLHPYHAYMMTSTFDPLVGKTSETDANNHTVYYQYDEFNRLKVIKDQNGNIRKSFVYNVK